MPRRPISRKAPVPVKDPGLMPRGGKHGLKSKPLLRCQLQRLLQSPLLEGCSLAKPGAVEAVFLIARPALVVHDLGDRAQQAPGRALGGCQLGASALTLVHGLHLLESALVGKTS